MFSMRQEQMAKARLIREAIDIIYNGSHDNGAKNALCNAILGFILGEDRQNQAHLLNATVMHVQAKKLQDDQYTKVFAGYQENPIKFGAVEIGTPDSRKIQTISAFVEVYRAILLDEKARHQPVPGPTKLVS